MKENFDKPEIRTLIDNISMMQGYIRYIRKHPELRQLLIIRETEDEYFRQVKILVDKICDELKGIANAD